MQKNRIEAFSDGFFPIIITVMVLELKIPHTTTLSALWPLSSIFLCYVLSFIYLAIYWNNHHHLFQMVKIVNGKVLLANIHLLFWLSLVPFSTAWAGENHFANIPTMLYGFVLLMASIAYFILTQTLIAHHGKDSMLAVAIGRDLKEKLSCVAYLVGVVSSYWLPIIGFSIYILVALVWFIPDMRIEKKLV